MKKSVFLAGNADWLSELSAVVNKYNSTSHHSIKITAIQASRKSIEKEVYSNLKDNREIQKPIDQLGRLLRTADIKRVFSKGHSTSYSYKSYTIAKVIHDTIPSYRINYLPERYSENLLPPTKLSLERYNKVIEELNLFQ